MGGNGNGKPLHAMVIPYPTQGHVTPMMQLSKTLAAKGLIVTFVTTYHRHAEITQANSCSSDPVLLEANKLGLDIRSAQISDGLPLNFDRSLKFYDFRRSVDNMGEALEELMNDLNKKEPPISCVIADTFLFWSLDVTKRFGIPWISFWTQPVAVYSIYHNFHLLRSHGHYPPKGIAFLAEELDDYIDYIPGVPNIQCKDLPLFLQLQDPNSDYVLDMLLKSYQSARRADWVLCNSFYELEAEAIKAMDAETPVLTVGPLLPSSYLDSHNPKDITVGTSFLTEYQPSEWLDSKPSESVIYVSFGSLVHVSKTQIEEIAMGLKESGQPFLWVLRPDIISSKISTCLPDSFMETCKSQGLVVPWLPQLQVLSHPSIGGFFTHCGWNSVTESIALGVPMLGFPLWTEQYTNCKLMVDEWKIGLRLRGGHRDDKVIHREEISRAIRTLVASEEGKAMKNRIMALRDSARSAMKAGGSSQNNIEAFIEDLKFTVHVGNGSQTN
ncbi:UDP-glycosyltransferase 86A1-like isoform X1 [Cryptomeria japonica]|uniref:UDP-glycosyltransferase 86A1-like isoform X1 n=1 Tax=Cryptomeria japonica TaxID=3369 RepID=UPI0027DA9476|nr:UDP-glycosyltransferase 86A1-like isoform X1 [Cryptomeria japonica]